MEATISDGDNKLRWWLFDYLQGGVADQSQARQDNGLPLAQPSTLLELAVPAELSVDGLIALEKAI